MSPPPRPSLRRRLLALLLGGAAVAWIALSLATWIDARHHTARIFDAQLVELSEVLSAVAGHEAFEIAGATTSHDRAYAQGCTYQVFSTTGDLLLRSHDAPNAALARTDGFSEAGAGGVAWRTFRRTDTENGLVVIVAHDIAERDALVRGIATRMVVPLLAGLPLAALALWLAVTRALRPLDRLAAEVGGREAGRLAPLQAPDAPAEVAPLVDALNELLARLARSLENERRFTGDAAHELRTPLAALKTHAQVALTTANDERRRRALEQVVAGTDRATRLVQQLLALARLDSDMAEAAREMDLAQPCREAVAETAPQAAARGVHVELRASSAAPLRGHPAILQSLARNLLENAIRHAPEGGTVRVSLGRSGARARLEVEDSGPGVPPDLRERIFDRLFRAPGESSGASGLGLSIARRIVELHGGTIAATSSPDLGGLRITADFPA